MSDREHHDTPARISPDDLGSGEAAAVFDIRFPEKRRTDGFIPGSVPTDRDDPVELREAIERGEEVAVYCDSEAGQRAFADQHGNLVGGVRFLDGGFRAWREQGLPIERPGADEEERDA